jgi:hypothetical protein
MRPEGEQFVDCVAPWSPGLEIATVAAIGIKEGDRLIVLAAQIVLGADLGDQIPIEWLECGALWAVREVVPVSGLGKLRDLIDSSTQGVISVSGKRASLEVDVGGGLISYFDPAYIVGQPFTAGNPRMVALRVGGGAMKPVFDRAFPQRDLEWKLQAANPPFFDITDLYSHLGISPQRARADLSKIEVFALPPVVIDNDSTLSQGVASIRLIAGLGTPTEKVSVRYRAYRIQDGAGSPSMARGAIPVEAFAWNVDGKRRRALAQFEVGNVHSLQAFVSLEGSAIQAWWIFDPSRVANPNAAAHLAFDRDLSLLKRMLLDSKKTEARTFEDAVSMLLGILGFASTQYGRNATTSDGPDILAWTKKGNLAVVECTVALPGQGDQFAKLLQRVEQIRRSLNDSGWNYVRILPVVVTALSQTEAATHIEEARGKKIVVLCKEHLERGLQAARQQPDADRWLDEAFQALTTQGQLL